MSGSLANSWEVSVSLSDWSGFVCSYCVCVCVCFEFDPPLSVFLARLLFAVAGHSSGVEHASSQADARPSGCSRSLSGGDQPALCPLWLPPVWGADTRFAEKTEILLSFCLWQESKLISKLIIGFSIVVFTLRVVGVHSLFMDVTGCCSGYVFSNLPGNAFNTLVRAFLSLELTMTFPIVLKPASDVIEQIMKNFLLVRTGFSSWLGKTLEDL